MTQGWIDFDGSFYPCRHFGHDHLSYSLWDLDEWSAQSTGRVKIYYDPYCGAIGKAHYCNSDPNYAYYVEKKLTQAQLETLQQMNFVIDSDDKEE